MSKVRFWVVLTIAVVLTVGLGVSVASAHEEYNTTLSNQVCPKCEEGHLIGETLISPIYYDQDNHTRTLKVSCDNAECDFEKQITILEKHHFNNQTETEDGICCDDCHQTIK